MSSRYLHFFEEDNGDRKTKIIGVYSINHGNQLGVIKWFGRWRQYAFYPSADTIWNPECLKAINDEIAKLMEARRNA